MARSLFGGIAAGLKAAAGAYGQTGSFGQATGTFWVMTKDYFVPNKQAFQVDGGRYGATYASVDQLESSQEFAIALNAISREVGASKYVIQRKAQNQDPTPITNPKDPLIKLFKHPNPLHSWQSWIETAIQIIFPTGNLYILMDPVSMLGTPMSLWILRSDRTRPVRQDNPLAPVQAYEHFAEDGRRYVFPPDRVFHIKMPNPLTDYQGLGVTKLLAQTLEADFRSMESNINMFRMGGRLSTVIEGAEVGQDPVKLKELKRKIQEAHMGSENAHRVLILEGAAKLNTAASSGQPKEQDYTNTRKDIARAIGAVMGVTPMLMGYAENINRATATVQQQQFLKNGVWPVMQRLEPVLTEICQMFQPDVVFEWPRVDVMDPETMAIMMKNGLEGGALSPNDAREKFLQLPRDKDDKLDLHYILNTEGAIENGVGVIAEAQATVMPGAGAPADPAQAKPAAKPALNLPPAPDKLTRGQIPGKKAIGENGKLKDAQGRHFPQGTREQRRTLAAIREARPKIEKALAPVFEKHFKVVALAMAQELENRGHRGITAKKFKGFMEGILKAYDSTGTPHGLKTQAKEVYQVQIEDAAKEAMNIFSVDMAGFDSGSTDFANVEAYLGERITGVDQTIKDEIGNLVKQGAEMGLSPWQIANGVTPAYIESWEEANPGKDFPGFEGIKNAADDIASERAMLIARTETTHLQDAIHTEAFKRMGVKTLDCIGCEDFVIMPGEDYGCNSQGIPTDAMPVQFHPNHNGAVVPSAEEE